MSRYSIEDPRPSAHKNPYTFFLPTPEEIAEVRPGVLVKLIFVSDPPGDYSGERMWVEVVEREGDVLAGLLDNDPTDTPAVQAGDRIAFEAHHILAVRWPDPEDNARFASDLDGWFARCFVDEPVLRGRARVQYLYREEPGHAEGDPYPDTGWRIRADVAQLTDDEYENTVAKYVAIGAVLNKDDSFVDLLGAPVGSGFFRESGEETFHPFERDA